jgi:hypothetical protein
MMFLRSAAARAALATCTVFGLAHCGARATLEGGNSVADAGGAAPTPEAGATQDGTTPLSCPAAGPSVCGAPDAAPDVVAEAQVTNDGGPFSCGAMIVCLPNEYCADHVPNVPHDGGASLQDTYLCVPAPLACQSTSVSCDCIESAILPGDACSRTTPGVTCTTDGAGNVTIHCQGV